MCNAFFKQDFGPFRKNKDPESFSMGTEKKHTIIIMKPQQYNSVFACVRVLLLVLILHQWNQRIKKKRQKGVNVGGSVLPAGHCSRTCSVERRNGTHLAKLRETRAAFYWLNKIWALLSWRWNTGFCDAAEDAHSKRKAKDKKNLLKKMWRLFFWLFLCFVFTISVKINKTFFSPWNLPERLCKDAV